MNRQLDIFPSFTSQHPHSQLAAEHRAKDSTPDVGWQGDRTWRFGQDHRIEYRYPAPTSPAPPPLHGATWEWNPLVPGWCVHYHRPPFSVLPGGTTADRYGPRLLPPPSFVLVDQLRLRGRCSRCRAHGTHFWGGPGWGGWGDRRVAAAYEAEVAAGRPCYGLTVVEVAGFGAIQPMSHYTRWGAGFCSACGAVSWNDFRRP